MTKADEKKPREWDIWVRSSNQEIIDGPLTDGPITVVSKIAYNLLSSENERLRKELEEANGYKIGWTNQVNYIQQLKAKTTKLVETIKRSEELFRYCAGPTRDVKTPKLKEGEALCAEALAEFEKES